jgi:hypothetical protein
LKKTCQDPAALAKLSNCLRPARLPYTTQESENGRRDEKFVIRNAGAGTTAASFITMQCYPAVVIFNRGVEILNNYLNEFRAFM